MFLGGSGGGKIEKKRKNVKKKNFWKNEKKKHEKKRRGEPSLLSAISGVTVHPPDLRHCVVECAAVEPSLKNFGDVFRNLRDGQTNSSTTRSEILSFGNNFSEAFQETGGRRGGEFAVLPRKPGRNSDDMNGSTFTLVSNLESQLQRSGVWRRPPKVPTSKQRKLNFKGGHVTLSAVLTSCYKKEVRCLHAQLKSLKCLLHLLLPRHRG